MNWLDLNPLAAGDWLYLFEETIRSFSFWPERWGYHYSGMGGPNYASGLVYFFTTTAKLFNSLGASWPLIERLVWFGPIFGLTLFSSFFLAKQLFTGKSLFYWLTPVLYFFNTYFLLLIDGGQLGVAFGYSLAPLILGFLVSLPKNHRWPRRLMIGLAFGLQILLEPRIFLLTLGTVLGYFILVAGAKKVYGLLLFWPLLLALTVNLFWLWPALTVKGGALPPDYGTAGWIGFLSFANFSGTLSLLHPNWPENIFGKTYLLRPEFLVLPVLAFSSLLFINYSRVSDLPAGKAGLTSLKAGKLNNSLINNKVILHFNLLALLGAFLAKGSNPPFGWIYLWLFDYLPGMKLFRDPTKFYFLVALSYSILIPHSLAKIYQLFFTKELIKK